MNKIRLNLLLLFAMTGAFSHGYGLYGRDDQLSLSGVWSFAIDSLDKGIVEEWFFVKHKA